MLLEHFASFKLDRFKNFKVELEIRCPKIRFGKCKVRFMDCRTAIGTENCVQTIFINGSSAQRWRGACGR